MVVRLIQIDNEFKVKERGDLSVCKTTQNIARRLITHPTDSLGIECQCECAGLLATTLYTVKFSHPNRSV